MCIRIRLVWHQQIVQGLFILFLMAINVKFENIASSKTQLFIVHRWTDLNEHYFSSSRHIWYRIRAKLRILNIGYHQNRGGNWDWNLVTPLLSNKLVDIWHKHFPFLLFWMSRFAFHRIRWDEQCWWFSQTGFSLPLSPYSVLTFYISPTLSLTGYQHEESSYSVTYRNFNSRLRYLVKFLSNGYRRMTE